MGIVLHHERDSDIDGNIEDIATHGPPIVAQSMAAGFLRWNGATELHKTASAKEGSAEAADLGG